jgi:hypothetical protein
MLPWQLFSLETFSVVNIIFPYNFPVTTISPAHPRSEFVHWLIQTGEAANVEEAVRLGQALLESGIIHHGQPFCL